MKQIMKKTTAAVLAAVMVVGAVQPSQAAAAGVKREKLTKEERWVSAYFSYPDCGMRDWVYLGKSIRATMIMPARAKIKSVSFSSGNKKVIKIVNKKKGLMKAVKTGKSKLTMKVVWTYSGRLEEPEYKYQNANNDYKTVTKKKGNTYTTKGSRTVHVFCKKHKYGPWKTIKEATADRDGKKQRICKVCGEKETEMIEAKGE